MQVNIAPGKYVVAVSGGVDSMALLDLLRPQKGIQLVVAHFDHGIRGDSVEDRKLVQKTAADLKLPFAYANGRLGTKASEAMARDARYAFLHSARQASGAKAIITAHHQDDVLETAIINILRGTNRRGLTALRSGADLVRPLLGYTKQELIDYAKDNKLIWRDDSTNEDESYLRNYVRRRILTRFDANTRQQLLDITDRLAETNFEIDTMLTNLLHIQPAIKTLDRSMFRQLPHNIARELMAAWLRERATPRFDKKTIERLVVAAKTGRASSSVDVAEGWVMDISAQHLALVYIER